MTTNEMAQKGFNTGFTDADGNELHVGDYVRLCGDIGEIVFSCGAFGIFIVDEVPWDALEELVRKDSGNRPSAAHALWAAFSFWREKHERQKNCSWLPILWDTRY